MTEKISAQIDGDGNKSVIREPAGKPPEQIVASDERDQKRKGTPECPSVLWARQRIDQGFQPILRANRATNGGQHRGQDRAMCETASLYITAEKSQWPFGVMCQFCARLLGFHRLLGKMALGRERSARADVPVFRHPKLALRQIAPSSR